MTNRKLFIAAAVISLSLVAGGSLYASPFFFTSPQKTATATQFWSDADNFIDVHSYSDVELKKFLSVISFQNANLGYSGDAYMLQLGFAAQFGGLYTALYYGGNTLALPEQIYQEDKNGIKVYTDWPADAILGATTVPPYNEAALLFGFKVMEKDMGVRLSFVSTYNSNNLKNFKMGTGPYEAIVNYQGEHGSLNPEIAWGLNTELIPGRGIKPHVYIDADFFRHYEKYDNGAGERILQSENEFTLGITAKAGGFSLIKDNGFDLGVDLWYAFKTKMFDNEYSQKEYDGSKMVAIPDKIVSFTGKKTSAASKPVNAADLSRGTYDYYDTSYNNHLITPYLCASWSDDRLMLAAELGLEFGITGSTNTGLITKDSKPKKHGAYTETSIFSFNPTLDLGLQWAIVPDRFFLNVGTSIVFFKSNDQDKTDGLSYQTSTITTYTEGVKDSGGSAKAVDNTFLGAQTSLLLGVTFNVTPNLSLQAMSGVGDNHNHVSLFDTGAGGGTSGLGVFSQIMATVKF